jgi:hypothetical protein
VSSKYSNFAQFVGYFIAGTPFKATLTKSWSTAQPREGATLVILTQPNVRRTLSISHTPKSIRLDAQDERIATLVALSNSTNTAHVAKFDAQAAYAAKAKAAIKLIDSMREQLAAGAEV